MKTNIKPGDQIQIRRYHAGELAALYQVHIRTLQRWLKPHENVIGKRVGYFYNVRQVKIIFEKLDLPVLPSENKKS